MEDFLYRVSIFLPGFLMAICFHEYAHAWMANRFGDPTAKNNGRLSLNPIVHFDPFGTVILPLVLAAMNLGVFGYARPVPIDARNFKKIRQSIFWVSFAGPLANIAMMLLSALLFSVFVVLVPQSFYLYMPIATMLDASIQINMVLAVFNLIPFPPLDGSRMVSSLLNYNAQRKYESIERFSFLFFLLLWFTNALAYLMLPARVASQEVKELFLRMLI